MKEVKAKLTCCSVGPPAAALPAITTWLKNVSNSPERISSDRGLLKREMTLSSRDTALRSRRVVDKDAGIEALMCIQLVKMVRLRSCLSLGLALIGAILCVAAQKAEEVDEDFWEKMVEKVLSLWSS